MEKLIIKNFGPIIEAEIEIRDINIFIGTTSSGKSTVAKLIAIFNGISLKYPPGFAEFRNLLASYNIDFTISDDTFLNYINEGIEFKLTKKNIEIEGRGEASYLPANPIYIPAERLFFSTVSQSIFTLLNFSVALPKWLIDFGAKFEQARQSMQKISLKFLDAEYSFEDSTDYVWLPNEAKIKLSQASSGLQSMVPLLLVILYNTDKKAGEDIFIIEEPELNLYPSSQKDLMELIVAKINQSGNDKLIITTHSPYLLTTIDNLIQAKNVVELLPEKRTKVEKLVNKDAWIDFERIACYYFDKGTCKSTLDIENKSIGPSNIDDVSLKLSETFENLLTLKYAQA